MKCKNCKFEKKKKNTDTKISIRNEKNKIIKKI